MSMDMELNFVSNYSLVFMKGGKKGEGVVEGGEKVEKVLQFLLTEVEFYFKICSWMLKNLVFLELFSIFPNIFLLCSKLVKILEIKIFSRAICLLKN